jgi:Flp pilus assembly protein CpaB
VVAGVELAAGRVVVVPVVRDGFVTERNLASRRRRGFDGALPAGSRAMRVIVSDAVTPRVGAAVDVLATFEDTVGDDTQGGSAAARAVVVADGVLVLAVDDARTSDGGTGVGITLLLTRRQSRELAFAVTHGVVTIALVPPEEARTP